MIKKIFKLIGIVLIGFFGGIVLNRISEAINFSHLNSMPGGSTWALWVYPVYYGISFGLASIIISSKKPLKFVFVLFGFLIGFLIIYLLKGDILKNPIPFGYYVKIY